MSIANDFLLSERPSYSLTDALRKRVPLGFTALRDLVSFELPSLVTPMEEDAARRDSRPRVGVASFLARG